MQHRPELYLIFWGSNWTGSGASLRGQLTTLFNSLAGSAWQGILTQYHDGTGYVSSQPSVMGSYVDGSVAAPTLVNDAAIRAEVGNVINANGWSRTSNAQFIVLTAPGSTYASGFGVDLCAYHSYDQFGSSYTFDPYAGDAPFLNQCRGYDPRGNVDHVTSMLASHEYSESATDPLINAWLTNDGYEIADICSSGADVIGSGIYVQGLWDNHQAACSLSDPHPVPVTVPAPVVEPNGDVSVFYRGFEGSIWDWGFHAGSWTNFNPGGTLGGDMSAVVGPSSTDAYYRRTTGTIGLLEWNGSSFATYDISGSAAGDPVAVVVGNGEDAYYRGTDGALWGQLWNGFGWTNTRIGGSLAGDPSAVYLPRIGAKDVFYRGTDGTIWLWEWNGSSWSNYHPGGAAAGDPSVIALPGGGDEAYYRGTDGALWGQLWNGFGWTNTRIGGSLAGDPSAVYLPRIGAKDVFYRGTDGTIWLWEWNGSSWSNYHPGGAAAGDPSVIALPGGGDEAFFQGPDQWVWGELWNGFGWTNTRLG